MLLRALVTSLLALVISTLTVVTPTPIGASSVTHETSMRPDEVTGKVSRTRVVSLERPADTVVAYWRGNPHADVRLAFSLDGTTFGRAEPAGRDEIGSCSQGRHHVRRTPLGKGGCRRTCDH